MGFSEILGSMAEAMVEVLTSPNTNFNAEEISALQKAENILRKHNWTEKAAEISIATLLKEAGSTTSTTITPSRGSLSNFEKVEKITNGLVKKGFRLFNSDVYSCTYLVSACMYVRVVEVTDEKIHVIVSLNKYDLISTKKLDDICGVDFVIDGGHIVNVINRGNVPYSSMCRIKDRMIPHLMAVIKEM